MRKDLFLILFSFLLFSLLCSNIGYAEEKQTHWELGIGPGINMDGKHFKHALIAPAFSLKSRGYEFLSCRLEGDLELIESDGRITAVVGAAPFIRLSMPERKLRPFFEIGAGANLISRNHTGTKNSGGPFIFSIMGGVGLEFSTWGRPMSISYRVRHLSNSHIYQANQSINSQYLMLSIGI